MANHQYSRKGLSIWFERLVAAILLGGQVFFHILKTKIHKRNTLEQMSVVGPESLTISMITGAFVGMVFTIQEARELRSFGAVNLFINPIDPLKDLIFLDVKRIIYIP